MGGAAPELVLKEGGFPTVPILVWRRGSAKPAPPFGSGGGSRPQLINWNMLTVSFSPVGFNFQ